MRGDIVPADFDSELPLLHIKEVTEEIKWGIEKEVMAGSSPEAAAIEVGMSIGTFRRLARDYDSFRDWIEEIKIKGAGELRKRVFKLTGKMEKDNPSKAAELYLKILEKIDEEFGPAKSKAAQVLTINVAEPIGLEKRAEILAEATVVRDDEADEVSTVQT